MSLNKHGIVCTFHSERKRSFYVTEDLMLLPCCYYADFFHPGRKDLKDMDPVLYKKMQDDPDWNNLEKHTMEEIIENKFYQKYMYHEGWDSDSPSKVCIKECSKYSEHNPLTKKDYKNNQSK